MKGNSEKDGTTQNRAERYNKDEDREDQLTKCKPADHLRSERKALLGLEGSNTRSGHDHGQSDQTHLTHSQIKSYNNGIRCLLGRQESYVIDRRHAQHRGLAAKARL